MTNYCADVDPEGIFPVTENPGIPMIGNPFTNLVFQMAGVDEIQALIHPDTQDFIAGNDLMALDIAKMLGTRYLTDDRHMWLAGVPQKQQNG